MQKHLNRRSEYCTRIDHHNGLQRWKLLIFSLIFLLVSFPAAIQACIVTNLPPTVCVNLLDNCRAEFIIKGYTTFGGAPGSQFCSCAFVIVPSIISVDSVEIRQCKTNELACSAPGDLLPGFQNGGGSSFSTDGLASSFFA